MNKETFTDTTGFKSNAIALDGTLLAQRPSPHEDPVTGYGIYFTDQGGKCPPAGR